MFSHRFCFVADADHNRKPLGSALHISKSLWNGRSQQDTQRIQLSSHEKPVPASGGLPALLRLSYNQNNHSNVEATAKNTRQFTQQDWRSKSEPMKQLMNHGQLGQRSFQTESESNQISQKGQGQTTQKFNESENAEFSGYPILGHILDKRRNNESITLTSQESERNGYNYVLNSLASDSVENSLSDSLPESPMHVPVKYPNSTPYSLSSDEDEPEDLSLNTEQPQNLTLSKTAANAKEIVDKQSENVKYDSNANAVSMPMGIISQLPNGQFIAQPRFNAPPNLIFHERNGGQNPLIGQPQILSSPNNVSYAQDGGGAIAVNQGPVFVAANSNQPHLQLINIRGQNPLTSPVFVPQGMISPTSGKLTGLSPPMLIPVTSPDGMTNLASAQTGSMLSNQQNGVVTFEVKQEDQQALLRKKRKKMDDTTAFRDPPEQSLPFNGPNKFRFYCDVCDTGFTRRYTFNRHKCKGRVEKHYCQLCDKAYLSKYKLKDHILVKHEGQTVNCPDCGKRFSSRSSMEMHKKQQHEGLFTIWCKVCGKGFNHTGHYYGHMNKHTNTKPFWCQQCGKRFYGSSYLHNHKQVCRGNNELNFACTICERKFKCELYLKKHMKVHDNVPILQDQDIPKMTDEDLSALGVDTSMHDNVVENGLNTSEDIYDGPVFPNAPEMSDSSSKNLVIDEADGKIVADDTNLNSTAESSKLVNDDSVSKQAVTA